MQRARASSSAMSMSMTTLTRRLSAPKTDTLVSAAGDTQTTWPATTWAPPQFSTCNAALVDLAEQLPLRRGKNVLVVFAEAVAQVRRRVDVVEWRRRTAALEVARRVVGTRKPAAAPVRHGRAAGCARARQGTGPPGNGSDANNASRLGRAARTSHRGRPGKSSGPDSGHYDGAIEPVVSEVNLDETSTVKVYNFWTYDKGTESPSLAPYKATREAIAQVWRGRLADGTEQVVPLAELDAKGRYRRVATGWGELQ
jgi:hypothetical protein